MVRIVDVETALVRRMVKEVGAVRLRQARLGEHDRRRSLGDDPPAHEQDMVAACRLAHVVGAEHDRRAPVPFLLHDGVDALVRGDVERRHRFVEQQNLGLLGKALGDEHALALATRELTEVTLCEVGDVETFHGLVDGTAIGGTEATEGAEPGVARHADDLPHGDGESLVHGRRLQDVRDAGMDGGGRGAEDGQDAALRLEDPGDGVHQGRLARAVGPDDARHRSSGDSHIGRRHDDGTATCEDDALPEDGDAGGIAPRGSWLRRTGHLAPFARRFYSETRSHSYIPGDAMHLANGRTRPVLALAVVLALVAAACGDEGGGGGGGAGDQASGRPQVVVSNSILGDIVDQVAGDDAEVDVLMPPGSDPHAFELSARQAASLRQADLVVVNGLGLEPNLDDAVEGARDAGVPVVEVAEAANPLPFDETLGEHAEDEHAEDEHAHEGDLDPHVWFDPLRMAAATEAIAEALGEIDETGAWEARAAEYVEALQALDEEIAAQVDDLPEERRRLVTNHEVLGYFAHRYGFEFLAAIVPGGSTLAEPSAADLADLVELIRVEGVPAIFAEASAPTRLADALRREIDRPVEVVPLFTESLGEPGSPADSYVGLMRENTRRIVEALAP